MPVARTAEDCDPENLIGVRFPLVDEPDRTKRDLPCHLRGPPRRGNLRWKRRRLDACLARTSRLRRPRRGGRTGRAGDQGRSGPVGSLRSQPRFRHLHRPGVRTSSICVAAHPRRSVALRSEKLVDFLQRPTCPQSSAVIGGLRAAVAVISRRHLFSAWQFDHTRGRGCRLRLRLEATATISECARPRTEPQLRSRSERRAPSSPARA
jgi:hypothetical protein